MSDPRHIVITGVTRGLGRALAVDCLERGLRVSGCGTRQEKLGTLPQDRHGHWAALDVREPESVRRWADARLAAWGPPQWLVNNAGRINRNAPLWEVPPEELSEVIDVNLKGTAHVIRAFLPAMIEAGSGVIVNMSSTWGRSTSPEVAPYCATKWGIEGLTRALSQELPAGLTAVALNPGIIHTEMLESCFGPAAASYPSPEAWAAEAAPLILGLGPERNGASLTVPVPWSS